MFYKAIALAIAIAIAINKHMFYSGAAAVVGSGSFSTGATGDPLVASPSA